MSSTCERQFYCDGNVSTSARGIHHIGRISRMGRIGKISIIGIIGITGIIVGKIRSTSLNTRGIESRMHKLWKDSDPIN